jgi:undecaprenyl-diphosphatase
MPRKSPAEAAVYLLALCAFAVLALLAHWHAYFSWDLAIASSLQRVHWLFGPMRLISIFGDGWVPVALTLGTAVAFLSFRKPVEAAGVVFSAGSSAALNLLIKEIVGRTRPSDTLVSVFRQLPEKSFPSGHVTFYVCYFGFLYFLSRASFRPGSPARQVAVLLLVPVALVGLSRVVLGEHWPSDVLGGYLWSGVWLAFSIAVYRRWKERELARKRQRGIAPR